MQKIKYLIAALPILMSGCMMTDAMKSVTDMDNKMDKMNSTTGQMSTTTTQMSATTDKMNQGMNETNSSIHKQTLGVALDELLKPDNTKYITVGSTVPTSLMPPGKIFAEEATQEEIAEFMYVTILEINTAQPDPALEDASGNYPKAVQDETDRDKWVKFNVMQVIAGLMPQTTVDDLIAQQITGAGRYEETAYNILYMRHLFISSYMLDETLLSTPLINPGMYEQAIEYVGYLNDIETLPFVKDIQLKLYGFFDAEKLGLNSTYTLDPANGTEYAKDYDAKLSNRLATELEDQYKTPTDPAMVKRMAAIHSALGETSPAPASAPPATSPASTTPAAPSSATTVGSAR